MLIETS